MTQPNQWSGQSDYNSYQQGGNWNTGTGPNTAGNWQGAGNFWGGQQSGSNPSAGNWNQGWGNNNNQVPNTTGTASSFPPNQGAVAANPQSSTGSNKDDKTDPELAEFDSQFKTWEGQFGKWKEENKDHPDKTALAKYEEQWTKWRDDLLARRQEIIAGKKDQPSLTSSNDSNPNNPQMNNAPPSQMWGPYGGQSGPNQVQGGMPAAQNWNQGQNLSQVPVPNQMNNWGPNQNNPNTPNWGNNNSGQNFTPSMPNPEQNINSQGQNWASTQSTNNQGSGPNQGQNFGPNQGQSFGSNQGQPFGSNQLQNYGPNQGQNFIPNKGQNFGPNQGQNFGPNQGQNFGPNQGQNFGPNQGSNFGPNQGSNFGPNQGQNMGANQGQNMPFNHGQNMTPNQGQMPSNQVPNMGPNGPQGSNFGPNQGQNFGPYQGQNTGPNQGQIFGPSQGQNFGSKPTQNFGPNQGQNFGPNQGQNFGPNQGQNFRYNQGPNSGTDQGQGSVPNPEQNFDKSNQGQNFGGPNQAQDIDSNVNKNWNLDPSSSKTDGLNKGQNIGRTDTPQDQLADQKEPGDKWGAKEPNSGNNLGPNSSQPWNLNVPPPIAKNSSPNLGNAAKLNQGDSNVEQDEESLGFGSDQNGSNHGRPTMGKNQGFQNKRGPNIGQNVDSNQEYPDKGPNHDGHNIGDHSNGGSSMAPNRSNYQGNQRNSGSFGSSQTSSIGILGADPSQGMGAHGGPTPLMGLHVPKLGMGSSGPRPGMGPMGINPAMGPRGFSHDMGMRGPNQGMRSRGPNQEMHSRGVMSGVDNDQSWNSGQNSESGKESQNNYDGFGRMGENSSFNYQGPGRNVDMRSRGPNRKPSRFDDNRTNNDVQSDANINMSWLTSVNNKQNSPMQQGGQMNSSTPSSNRSIIEGKPNVPVNKVPKQPKKEGVEGNEGISRQAQSRSTGNILALFRQRAMDSNSSSKGDIPGLDIPSNNDNKEETTPASSVDQQKKSPAKPKMNTEPETKPELKFGEDRLNIGPIGVETKANDWKPTGEWYDDEDIENPDLSKLGPDIDSFGKKKRISQPDNASQPKSKVARPSSSTLPSSSAASGLVPATPGSIAPLESGPNPTSASDPSAPSASRGDGNSSTFKPPSQQGGSSGPRPLFAPGPLNPFGGRSFRGTRGGRGRRGGRGGDSSFFELGPCERGTPPMHQTPSSPFFELGAADTTQMQENLRTTKVVDYGHKGADSRQIPQLDSLKSTKQQQYADESAQASPPPSLSGQKVSIEDLLEIPGRFMRPPKLVIVLRGLPGSGKTTLAKMIKDKEIENGGSAPRILCLDDYFMVESEKLVVDEETGRKVKTKIMEYEYEPELEENYRKALVKSFKKQIDEKFFPFIIIDCVNNLTENYKDMVSYCSRKEFEFYIGEVEVDVQTCYQRNTRKRKLIDLQKMALQWEKTPSKYTLVDLTSMIQDANIQEVEMEDCEMTDDLPAETKESEADSEGEDDLEASTFKVINELMKSKWDTDHSQEEKLDKLDGVRAAGKKKNETIDDWLQLSESFKGGKAKPGKKTVRWADIEERREQLSARHRGFVLGQTNWDRMTDPSLGSDALVKVRYIEPRSNKE